MTTLNATAFSAMAMRATLSTNETPESSAPMDLFTALETAGRHDRALPGSIASGGSDGGEGNRMAESELFIDTEGVFSAVASLRSHSRVADVAMPAPTVHHPGLQDTLGRLAVLAAALPGDVRDQVGALADAISIAAADTVFADQPVEVATGTTSSTTTVPGGG